MTGPRDAQVTIVGGGAVGAAVAYFLARHGRRDIQLLEARGLCEATSSQAAGLVGQARPTAERARLTMAAAEVYRGFERETGYTMDYRECGALRIALSDTSVRELEQIAETAKITGLPVEFLSEARLREIHPALERTEAVRAADAVFFTTPEYNSSIPGALKNALDWVSRPTATNAMRNKPVAVIGASAGMFGAVWAQAELRKVLGAMGARVAEGEVAVGHAMDRFDSGGRLNEPNLEEEVREVARTLIAEARSADLEPLAA